MTPDTISVTADDLAGVLQRQCRQLDRALDGPQVVPQAVIMHIERMQGFALRLSEMLEASQAQAPEQATISPNGESRVS